MRQLATASAAYKGHFRQFRIFAFSGFEVFVAFEMRQRTFEQMASASFVCVCESVLLCVWVSVCTHCNCCRNIKAMRVFQLTSSVDCVKYAKNVLGIAGFVRQSSLLLCLGSMD